MAKVKIAAKKRTKRVAASAPDFTQDVNALIRNMPESMVEVLRGPRPKLSHLFPGEQHAGIRDSIINTGSYRQGKAELRMKVVPVDNDHEIVAMGTVAAAAVGFDPGPTINFIDQIQDFGSLAGKSKALETQQLWQIYKAEGIMNNAINKISAILSGGGHYKVRGAKQGRKPDAVNRLLKILQSWQDNVNASAEDAVVTGAMGLQAITHQAVRRALVEGDWVARHVWINNATVIGLPGNYKLPMNVQSISVSELKPLEGLPPGAQAFYWEPAGSLVDKILNPEDKNAAKIIKQFLPSDWIKQLKKDRRVFLDPALMLHVKHRGVDTDIWGESFISPALQAIAYKRAIDQLDFQTMTNLINRLTIVMVGSSDPNSPFSKPDVAAARQSLMASFFEDPGPNMTIVWAGDDVKVENVGSLNDVLSLDTRHEIATEKIKQAIGVPEALLSGTMSDGKASGIAASLGAAAQLEELQNSFSKVYTQLGLRIAVENGFTDIDLIFEFDKSLLVDRIEEWTQSRGDYVAGLITLYDYIANRGKDPDAVFVQKCFEKGLDPATTTWEIAFMPPQGMAGQSQTDGQPALNGPGQGRQPDNQQVKPKTQERPTKSTTRENK